MRIKKVLLCFLMIIAISFGASLTLKAAIGVGAWDALAQTGSLISKVKVGTVGMIFNFLCIFIQLLILRKDFKIRHAMQILLSFIVGYMINFFFYDVFGNWEIKSYILRVSVLIIGYIINAFVVAVIMLLDVVTFSLEGACMAISNRFNIKFPVLRQAVDFGSIILVLILSFIFDVSLSVREGTVIGMLIFAPVMGIFMKILKPYFIKTNLLDSK